jgi:tRNA A-37 threonylcarbamoyl transferase component Bud32
MRADAAATELLAGIDSRLTVRAELRETYSAFGLTTPEAFLALPGVIVSGHPDRNVSRVVLPDGTAAYLKREHVVRRKSRFRNWRDGFGRVSLSAREGMTLRQLEALNFPAPRWLAYGEDGEGRAFLLVAETAGVTDLRRLNLGRKTLRELAVRLGRQIAEFHAAGVDHPDLFAKHVLVDSADLSITLLDWQRTRFRESVPGRDRVRSLAALHATAPNATNRHILARFLWAYRRSLLAQRIGGVPSFAQLVREIEEAAHKLQRRRGIREQRQPPLPAGAQRLVCVDGEAIACLPEIADEITDVREALYPPSSGASALLLPGGRECRLETGRYWQPLAFLGAWIRRQTWRAPEVRRARLLFHLERHHIPAPRLLGYGHRRIGWGHAAFLLAEALPARAVPLTQALRDRDAEYRELLLDRLAGVLAKLHDAGCEAVGLDRFALAEPGGCAILISDYAGLVFRKRLSERHRRIDRNRLARSIKDDCGPGAAALFLRAYDGHRG